MSEDDALRGMGGNGFGDDFEGTDNPPMLGTNGLITAINKFETTVNKLEGIARDMATSFQGGVSSYGHVASSPQQQQASQGNNPTGGGYAQQLPSMGLGPRSGGPGGPGGPPPGGGGGGGGAGSGGGPGPGGFGPGMRRTFGHYGPGGGGGNHNIGGISFGRSAGFGGAVIGGLAALSGMGESQFRTQVNMSSFVQQQQLMAPDNFTGNSFANAARFQAFGGGNRNLNAVAMGPDDAAAGQSIINSVAGAPASFGGRYANAFGRNAAGAANAFGYTNPGLGAAGSAALAANMYSPQTSMRMMMMGYKTPLSMSGGNPASSGAVMQGMLSRMFNGNVSSKQLAFSLRNGGIANMDLQQIVGSNPSTVEAYTNTLEAFNRLRTGAGGQKRLTVNQAQTLLNQAGRDNKGAQDTLQRYGVNRSALQNIKNSTAVSTGTSADINQSFTAGLASATNALSGFREMLNDIARSPVGQAGAYGSGFMGTLGKVANPGGILSLGGSIAQIAMLRRMGGLGGAGGGVGMGGGGLLGGGGGAATAADAALTGGETAGGLAGLIAAGGGVSAAIAAIAPLAAGVLATTAVNAAIGKVMGGSGAYQKNLSQLKAKHTGYLGPIPLTSWADPIVAGGMTAAQWTAHQFGTQKFAGITSHGVRSAVDDVGRQFGWNKAFGLTAQDVKGWFGAGGSKTGPAQGGPNTRSSGGHMKGGKNTRSGVSNTASSAARDALTQVGVPYRLGGEDPKNSSNPGMDCSGLMQWSYGQAGEVIPRTSETQWAAYKGRSIAMDKVQEGDLVFQAGSEGTTNNPGHVAMMISHTQIVEAPHTGLNVRVRAYSDKEWTHAARPNGSVAGSGAGNALGGGATGTGGAPKSGVNGDAGLSAAASVGMGSGDYGSSEELDNVMAALMGGGGGGGTAMSTSASPVARSGAGGKSSSGGGGKLTAPGPGRVGWAEALLKGIGAPVNQQTKSAVVVWEVAEGGGFGNQAANNPLNLNPGPGAKWPGHNANGAWAFPTAADGLKESVDYLHMSNFAGINKALRAGKSEHAILQAIVASPWAGSHYAGNGEMQSGLKNSTGGRTWGLAAGTISAIPGMYWTGERGPELKSMGSGDQLFSATLSHDAAQAAKRPAEKPWMSLPPNGLHQSQGGSGSCSVDVKLHIEKIEINGATGNKDMMADEFLDNVVRKLESNKALMSIAAGHTHG